ncbi:hypothetical protein DWF00_16690 [Bosea caraganae]|uniref:Uncharacterized protein n=1 Tax=Bosea caraganae TaxID=2763117 RepID=A0A370KZ02_9HYPH|nr:hypothetical protein [Bosea caraganae]RDJ20146.1 hypothetical protein DWE98_26290 [Bosea caraganae]RDJ24858.1 hypothetical protein DWF00_16690 [Bosea caraganae]
MNAVTSTNRVGAYEPRAFLMVTMSMAALHLGLATDHLATDDDIALKRSLEKFGACVKAMLDTVPEVFADKNGGTP